MARRSSIVWESGGSRIVAVYERDDEAQGSPWVYGSVAEVSNGTDAMGETRWIAASREEAMRVVARGQDEDPLDGYVARVTGLDRAQPAADAVDPDRGRGQGRGPPG